MNDNNSTDEAVKASDNHLASTQKVHLEKVKKYSEYDHDSTKRGYGHGFSVSVSGNGNGNGNGKRIHVDTHIIEDSNKSKEKDADDFNYRHLSAARAQRYQKQHMFDCNNFDSRGSMDVEFMLQGSKGIQGSKDEGQQLQQQQELGKGFHVRPIRNKMSLFCHIPPKCGTNTFASFTANTGFLHQRGYADTTLSLGYQLFAGSALLCDWYTVDGTSKVSLFFFNLLIIMNCTLYHFLILTFASAFFIIFFYKL